MIWQTNNFSWQISNKINEDFFSTLELAECKEGVFVICVDIVITAKAVSQVSGIIPDVDIPTKCDYYHQYISVIWVE